MRKLTQFTQNKAIQPLNKAEMLQTKGGGLFTCEEKRIGSYSMEVWSLNLGIVRLPVWAAPR